MQFLKRKGISLSAKVYFIDALGAMALGLFASLLIGTIFGTIADYVSYEPVSGFLKQMQNYCNLAQGPSMAMAIGTALGAQDLFCFRFVRWAVRRRRSADLSERLSPQLSPRNSASLFIRKQKWI